VFFITAYLGILKSGNVCVPLNYAIEEGNLDYILDLTESPLMIVTDKFKVANSIKEHSGIINEIDLAEIIGTQETSIFESAFDEDRIAEIIFTSGSTGEPKGVMISHRNILANSDSIIQYLKLTDRDRMCVVLPFFYCYGLSLLHTHLRVGGSIVLNNSFIFIGSVIKDLKEFQCTGFAGVPSHFQILLKKSQSFKNTKFPDLRYVTQAGGKLHAVFIDEFIHAFPEIPFFVMYGQTEATARLSYLPPKMLPNKMSSIGIAIPGVTLKVVNEEGNETKTGTEGELLAKGDNVMMGYYKDEESTNKTLINGWLHTGDIAKKDKDGFIFIVARQKEIIKVGGKRVSPKEIEEVILSVPKVVDCTINGIEDELLGEAIKATIVINDLKEKDAVREQLLKTCSEKLALYKIPQLFSFESYMNVNATGKKTKLNRP
jgi:acyl-CoA synthetase (AMP-forming)/AMP-acid ligase II